MRRAGGLLALLLSFALLPLGSGTPVAAAPKHDSPKWALLVGVDAYRAPVSRTGGSVGDVEDLHKVLLDSGWPADHIRILTDERATAAAIREGWRWLQSVSSDTSFSVFHYSGHIKQMTGDRDRDGENQDEFLWPVDNNFLSDGELGANMRALKGMAWVDISGCEAAGLNDNIASPKRLFTGASQEHEKAYDHSGWRNSIFTGLLADRGMLQGQGDANADGLVSIHEAFRFAEAQAPEFTKRQSAGPQHPYMAGGDGTEWFIAPPPPPVAPAPEEPPPSWWPFGPLPPV